MRDQHLLCEEIARVVINRKYIVDIDIVATEMTFNGDAAELE